VVYVALPMAMLTQRDRCWRAAKCRGASFWGKKWVPSVDINCMVLLAWRSG